MLLLHLFDVIFFLTDCSFYYILGLGLKYLRLWLLLTTVIFYSL